MGNSSTGLAAEVFERTADFCTLELTAASPAATTSTNREHFHRGCMVRPDESLQVGQ